MPSVARLPVPSDRLEEELARCARCGQCRSVCPVFLETGEESQVARGRIALAEAVLQGRLGLSRRVVESFRSCISCMRCGAQCPTGVGYEAVLHAVRFGIARDLGVPWLARLIFRWLLPRRWLFDLVLRWSALLQRLVPLPRRGAMRHLPLFFAGRRWIPELARRTALRRYPRPISPERPKGRVAFFTGCLINAVYVDIADDLVYVLRRLGYEVVLPGDQVCCGTPVLSYGDLESARRLARINRDAFLAAGADIVVVACASCGRTLKTEYPRLLGEDWTAGRFRILDTAELLAGERLEGVAPLSRKVTYHDPCHLNWGQGITREPRDMLRRCADYVEMRDAERCCGNGGTFSLFHYDLSVRISEHKVRAIGESGADVVATNCPGCRLQFADRLAAAGSQVESLHTVQVLRRAMDASAGE